MSVKCGGCNIGDGTLGHLLMSCPKLKGFWVDILQLYDVIYKKMLSQTCIATILEYLAWLQQKKKNKKNKAVLREWKQVTPLFSEGWLKDMFFFSCFVLFFAFCLEEN